jgi:hypothetical protein
MDLLARIFDWLSDHAAAFQDPRRPSPNSSNPGRSRLARVRIVGPSPSAANIPWAS